MIQTRYKSLLRSLSDDLPGELWLVIFDKLTEKCDIESIIATSRSFRALAPLIWRGQCMQRWSDIVLRVEQQPSVQELGADYWKSLHTLLRLRESDVSPIPSSPTILPRFRAIVVEWMMEVRSPLAVAPSMVQSSAGTDNPHLQVCMEWNLDHELDSNIVFHAVRYLDYCLQTISDFVPQRYDPQSPCRKRTSHSTNHHRLQLVGISCIRAALYTYRRTASTNVDIQRVVQQNLDIHKAANITNNACSDRDIRFTTSSVRKLLPPEMRTAPTHRTYLRWYWAWLLRRGAVTLAHAHIYDLAGYVLFFTNIAQVPQPLVLGFSPS